MQFPLTPLILHLHTGYRVDQIVKDKIAAGMQHTPPRDIFNAKKIILKLALFMQSLKKIGKDISKIESEKPIYCVNQGPSLFTYLSKFIHLQYQDTTVQYQVLYPV